MFLDNPNISRVVFFPRKTKKPSNLGDNIEALSFSIHKEISIGIIAYIKNKDLPTILLFHGNGEVSLDYVHGYTNFHEIDVNLAVADFRGYGFSSGSPIYSGLIDDALPTYYSFHDWMVENGYKDSLFVEGRSLGSVCAAEIGSHNPKSLKGIIFESGFASIYNMMTRLFQVSGPNITEELLKPYSNDTRIRKIEKPTLVLHGNSDWIVPVEEGKLIFKNIPESTEKELIIIKGAGHNSIFGFKSEYFTPLKNFIEKHKN